MPCKDFTTDDIVSICSEIARSDNIVVQLPSKRINIFRRSSSNYETEPAPRKSSIARKLSLVNGIPCDGGKILTPELPSIERRKLSVDSCLNRMKERPIQEKRNASVPGLRGRDIVAVAILVDSNGIPIRTYTEDQDIPSDEVESADHIFLSRIPMMNSRKQSSQVVAAESNENIKLLEHVLAELDENKRQKIMKRLDRILIKLHTTDLNTAVSFLKTDRFANVRKEIKQELLLFVTKELKMTTPPLVECQ